MARRENLQDISPIDEDENESIADTNRMVMHDDKDSMYHTNRMMTHEDNESLAVTNGMIIHDIEDDKASQTSMERDMNVIMAS